MADTADAPAAPASSAGKKKAAKPKKAKSAPTHPKVSEMVTSAITDLKERGGSSLQAIKKHIAANNKVDVEKLSPFIKKYLKNAVVSGALVQTKGKGATGSFKLSSAVGKPKETAAKPKKAPASAAKKAKPATPKKKKAAKPKTAKKPAAAAAKKAKPKPAKSPKKAKATKPKAPKPKKAKTPAKKAGAKRGRK